MKQVEFIHDDYDLAKKFVLSLPPKIQRERFANFKKWTPERVVIAKLDHRIVAMADAIVTIDDSAANVSLLARPEFGAYAIRAMHELRRRLDGRALFSTLHHPKPSTIAISRRFFDEVFDQGAWEMSSHLIKTYGQDRFFLPPPMAVTDRFMKAVGLPRVSLLNEGSRQQVLRVAKNPAKAILKTPTGFIFDGPHLMALAFDVVDLPMKHRQSITRMNLLSMTAAKGLSVSPEMVGKVVDPRSLGQFLDHVKARDVEGDLSGCFEIEAQNISIEGALRTLQGKPALPGLPSGRRAGQS
ncbi:hypothetical protein RMR21_004410 [Agrobacterium sp. rho-8.1]|nr:hypothetical protein [Agrobacterium sp. rho-8.1]